MSLAAYHRAMSAFVREMQKKHISRLSTEEIGSSSIIEVEIID